MSRDQINRRTIRTASDELQEILEKAVAHGCGGRIVLGGTLSRNADVDRQLELSTEVGATNVLVAAMTGRLGAEVKAERIVEAAGEVGAFWLVDLWLPGKEVAP